MFTEGSYIYTIEAMADGGAIQTLQSSMIIDDSDPAPVVTPADTITTDTGVDLEVFAMGNPAVPLANVNIGDGISYVSSI